MNWYPVLNYCLFDNIVFQWPLKCQVRIHPAGESIGLPDLGWCFRITELQEIFTDPGNWSMVMDTWGTQRWKDLAWCRLQVSFSFRTRCPRKRRQLSTVEIRDELCTVQNGDVLNKKQIFYKKTRKGELVLGDPWPVIRTWQKMWLNAHLSSWTWDSRNMRLADHATCW